MADKEEVVDSRQVAEPVGVYSFTYADGRKSGYNIRERLCIDRRSGHFEWSRVSDAKGKEVAHGGAWFVAMVSGVRFTTRTGDPGREFSAGNYKEVSWKRDWIDMVIAIGSTIKHLMVFLINPLALAAFFTCGMTGELWRIFPTDKDGKYEMSYGGDDSALDWTIALSFLTIFIAFLAGWWLGIFRCRCGRMSIDSDTTMRGAIVRLPESIADRWRIQRPLYWVVVSLLVFWCLFVFISACVAKGVNREEVCRAPYPDEFSISRAMSLPAGEFRQCYEAAGEPLTCGVGACACRAAEELSCRPPPPQPAQVCTTRPRPLCTGAGSADNTSGSHAILVFDAIFSSIVTGLILLVWLVTELSMFFEWFFIGSFKVINVRNVQLRYHKFVVSFRSEKEKTLVFTLGAHEDPHAVAADLLPSKGPRFDRSMTAAASYQAPTVVNASNLAVQQVVQRVGTGAFMPAGLLTPGTPTAFGMPPMSPMGQAVNQTAPIPEELLEPQWC